MTLNAFHPAVARWFGAHFGKPTEAQRRGWPSIQAQRHTLIAAPTGSGKTLAAFLASLDALVRQGVAEALPDATQVLYVSPLRALSNDVERNLQTPMAGIAAALKELDLPAVPIRSMVRTGDTRARERSLLAKRPPHILVTTPESFYILLTSDSGRAALGSVRTVIVDEIHALVSNKRGAHLALSLERLEALTREVNGQTPTRVGLSATQRPIQEVARFLVGSEPAQMAPKAADSVHATAPRARDCALVDLGHARALDLKLELPASPLEAVMAGEVWEELYDRLAELIELHRTTLVFVNTRRLAERITRHLEERLGAEAVCAHHGSLSRDTRFDAEQRLKAGALRALVATASLELGIDIGSVELVCQIGSTKSVAALLQRVGRSGHNLGGLPKGRLFPLSRDELVECVALLDAVRAGELDRVCIPDGALDILAQQLIATVATGPHAEAELLHMVRASYPYRALAADRFEAVLRMLAEGFDTTRGRRASYLHHDKVNRVLRPRRGARLAAITSGGAIPDTTDYRVILEPEGTPIGTLNEDFVIESMQGDIFQLGNASWEILKVDKGQVRVQSAQGKTPTIPFWLGEAPARSHELSSAVSQLRAGAEEALDVEAPEQGKETSALQSRLQERYRLSAPAAQQLAAYLAGARAALGSLPTQHTVVAERFFDESGGMQLVVHAPFGSRLNRAWGLALRKRFCRSFNVELQAAATEDAIVLSLGPMHSFPLEEVTRFLRASTVRDVLVQALLDAPMFATRWRWNAIRSLAILRQRGGRRVPPYLQRLWADDLLAAAFPDQVACLENVQGDREIPGHPLVQQTIQDCLTEAMDIDALEDVLRGIADGTRRFVVRELSEPSPLAHEVLNARPYAFLDDAPLEERRTQAVLNRRFLDPKQASELGALDPEAIARVCDEAWPRVQSAEELHDALVLTGLLAHSEVKQHPQWLDELARAGRATRIQRPGLPPWWVAAERRDLIRAAFADAELLDADVRVPDDTPWDAQSALAELVRCRLEVSGPVTVSELSRVFGVAAIEIELALSALQAEGYVLSGRFRTQSSDGQTSDEQWCERRLLARIHRYTLKRLRQEIEPVPVAAFMRFLFTWQKLTPEHQVRGPHGLVTVLEQLEGFGAAAVAWEADLLAARACDYEPTWLDAACLGGQFMWARALTRRVERVQQDAATGIRSRPVRSTPTTFLARERLGLWLRQQAAAGGMEQADSAQPDTALSANAQVADRCLNERGALFFNELQTHSGLLRSQLEEALGELVSAGRVSSDSYAGLRALLVPSAKRDAAPRPLARAGSGRRPPMQRPHASSPHGITGAGRWSLIGRGDADLHPHETDVEACARLLLRRYGVVFRKLLERECVPRWRELVLVYRRLEARGEIRGGRFVAAASGEQYALPEAVSLLRKARQEPECSVLISLSAADPLNLIGILTPGPRVAAVASNRVLYRGGTPVASLEAGQIRLLEEVEPSERWRLTTALQRRHAPPELRGYLGRSIPGQHPIRGARNS